MTGYASIIEQVNLPSVGTQPVTIELKSLNGRFFEVVSKLSGSLNSMELSINSLLQEKLIRGRIYLNIHIGQYDQGLEKILPSWPAIDQYLSAAQAIKQKYNLSGDMTLVDLVKLPNVLVTQENPLTKEDEKTILALVTKVADMLVKVRSQEGLRLEKDFEKIFKVCTEKIGIITKAFAQALEQQRELVKQAIAQNPHPDQPNPHIDELQMALKKMDIHEEVTRFKSHLDSLDPLLKAEQIEKGKRLDFILQELLRETNTMMAKCQAYQVSASCIDIKVEVEKAREQIQNIV